MPVPQRLYIHRSISCAGEAEQIVYDRMLDHSVPLAVCHADLQRLLAGANGRLCRVADAASEQVLSRWADRLSPPVGGAAGESIKITRAFGLSKCRAPSVPAEPGEAIHIPQPLAWPCHPNRRANAKPSRNTQSP